MRRKTCLVVFPDDYIAYSPTVLNLLALLSAAGIETRVITFESDHPINGLVADENLIRVHPRVKQALTRLRFYADYKLRRLIARIRKEPACDHYIGVDSLGALALQAAGIARFDLLSLEVHRDEYFERLDLSRIRSVVIQSSERYSFLFPERGPEFHLVQNAPVMESPAEPRTLHGPPRLVFLGNAIPSHGIFECIELVSSEPELTLEVCGLVPPRIADCITASPGAKRIHVRTQYVDQADLRRYLDAFDIGICLYNVARSDFNYQSVPSGKLFNYFSVGLPVVATDLIGLRSVTDFGAGVVVRSNALHTLKSAVQAICNDYSSYSSGAARPGTTFSFQRMAQPYVESIVA
jgi:glycosyltransferase involved in cell wall biosynthesis